MNEKKDNVVRMEDKTLNKEVKGKNTVGKAKLIFEDINPFKYFTDLDKNVSKDEKAHADKVIDAISGIKDDKVKGEVLSQYITSNHSKQIKEKIIYAVKYLSGTILTSIVVIILQKNRE